MKTLRGRCPRCCPDGGACFTLSYSYELEQQVKKCSNCHLEIPRRKYTRSNQPTKSQQRVIDHVLSLFGGTVEVKMIGRKVWVKFTNESRPWYDGKDLYGTISVNGSYELRLPRLFATEDIKITDGIGLRVYCTTKKD